MNDRLLGLIDAEILRWQQPPTAAAERESLRKLAIRVQRHGIESVGAHKALCALRAKVAEMAPCAVPREAGA